MSETKAVVPAQQPPPAEEKRTQKLDLSDLPIERRAYINDLRAQVMVMRGIREHCDWLEKTGGLPLVKDDDNRKESMKPGTAAIAIGVGCELGFPMNVALTKVVVINNRPAIYGDVALALVRKRGLTDPKKGGGFKTWYTGSPGTDEYTAHAHAKRADTGEELETEFSIGDAKRAGLWGVRTWIKWGALRMLRYRAIGFLLRDLFSDVLLGLHIAEELYGPEPGETPEPQHMTAPPASSAPVDPLWAGAVDAEVVPANGQPAAVPAAETPVKTPPASAPEPPGEPQPAEPASEPATAPAAAPVAPAAEPAEPPKPLPPAASQPADPAEPFGRTKGGQVIEEVDADGRPTVVKKAVTATKPKPSPAAKPASAPVAKPAEPAPAAKPIEEDADTDVAKVRAAIAAARAKAAPKPPAQAPADPQGKVFEE